ncbi:Receptor-type tyrosine-protein phosphatase N2 [Aphelenchoides besseyi]|nr:Receptor-type tyrosine-protein phosphatase N2 [Aphelenchoides besseyi]
MKIHYPCENVQRIVEYSNTRVHCLQFLILLASGCRLDSTLCDSTENCIPDGLFGQCYAEDSDAAIPPILLDSELTDPQKVLLRLELETLAEEGLDWRDDRAQCILAYYKLAVTYNLNYDTEFCAVRSPNNVLTLIQRIQSYLSQEEEPVAIVDGVPNLVQIPALTAYLPNDIELPRERPADLVETAMIVDEDSGDAVPAVVDETARDPVDDETPLLIIDDNSDPIEEGIVVDNAIVEPYDDTEDRRVFAQAIAELTEANMANNANKNETSKTTAESEQKEKRADTPEELKLSGSEEKELKEYVTDILDKQKTNIHKLSTAQLEKLVTFIGSLQENLENTEVELPDDEQLTNAEQEETIPLTSVNNGQQLLLKKDIEKFNYDDMGLTNIEHKIVKGDIQRVEGNRVYLKVGKDNVTEEEMYKLIIYLDKKIAEPNNLYFDEFQYYDGQLSFRISRLDDSTIRHKSDKRVDSASRVAQAVYKRRKDIQTMAGVKVDETGIGSGVDVVPVERSERDWLFYPILTVCAFTITSLIVLLAVHVVKNRRRPYKSNFPEVVDHLEGKASTAYEELCRQRMNSQDVPIGITVGKSTSTSSWPDETLLQSCNLDISTGHVILSFLQEYLDTPEKIADQWKSVAEYVNSNAETTIAEREENRAKNADPSVLPYDETVVMLKENNEEKYINASKIHDSDLRQVAYIATQAPLENTVIDFWQCIWEQGITLIVNLCDQNDALKYQRYWPDEGAKTYERFEVHLVSEHIWSEDYMVRSFYLKNTETNETRTVTQFHYLAWAENGTPASVKSLLEFRRKVNKSYRGRASPVLVHCSTGTDRTGTYCLMDIVVNRITKGAGIKELNIAGSLEHLRDQRMRMVGNVEQYKFVFSCVAEEVNALLKNQQQ